MLIPEASTVSLNCGQMLKAEAVGMFHFYTTNPKKDLFSDRSWEHGWFISCLVKLWNRIEQNVFRYWLSDCFQSFYCILHSLIFFIYIFFRYIFKVKVITRLLSLFLMSRTRKKIYSLGLYTFDSKGPNVECMHLPHLKRNCRRKRTTDVVSVSGLKIHFKTLRRERAPLSLGVGSEYCDPFLLLCNCGAGSQNDSLITPTPPNPPTVNVWP